MSFPAYPTHKDSGSEWIGAIPDHWSANPLKREFKIEGGSTPPPDEANWDGDIAWVTPADLSGLSSLFLDASKRTITAIGLASCGTTLFPAGSLILSTRAPIGSLAIALISMCTNQGCKGLVPNANTSAAYFAFVLLIAKSELNNRGRGSTFLEISGDELSRFSVPTPPFAEQTQIARFLDHETARIDALIEEQQRLIELLKEKRQAVISHAVTKGLDPTVPMKDSGVEWLGEVPAHWAIKRLKQLVLDAAGIQMGPFGGMLVNLDDSDTGYKVYGQENTISGDFSSGNRWVPESRYVALSNYHLEVGDIVLTRKGSLGNCRRISLLPQAGIIDSDTIRVRVQNQIINPDYLELLLHEAGYISTQLSLVKRGAILSGLNSEIIANLVIVVPPPEGQEELLLEIKAASSRFDQGISDCEYAVGLLRERRSALISAAVTGKIDVRGWQPPASATSPELAQEAV
ncbi:restriction endonuclease subunit S [Pseudomonas protegens]|uniref:restriction endonuclease subunit S n=1 Tax=Pseudomonas protegens TaxID=380021 RepID=UPI000D81069E|nr:restriction endonuclease subunit S [Pseudomonas protegens]PYC02000.1 restriction endonuclease subunit S [Pseudomonas protegens]